MISDGRGCPPHFRFRRESKPARKDHGDSNVHRVTYGTCGRVTTQIIVVINILSTKTFLFVIEYLADEAVTYMISFSIDGLFTNQLT